MAIVNQTNRVCLILMVVILVSCSTSSVHKNHGYEYVVPPEFLSTRDRLADNSILRPEAEALLAQLYEVKKYHHTVIDILELRKTNGSHGGITIVFEPLVEDTPQVFMDDVFRALDTAARSQGSNVFPTRIMTTQDSSNGFYRMDVSDAYSKRGLFASYLTRGSFNGQLQITIITTESPHSSHYTEVVDSIRDARK